MDSSDDLAANLRNYEIQLQQVVAALESDANNEELLKLKNDLEEVVALTKELMGPIPSQSSSSSGSANVSSSQSSSYSFRAGDKVLAPWSVDGLYYEARIDDVTSDGQCTVTFSKDVLPQASSSSIDGKPRRWDKGINEVCLVSLLKPTSDSGSYKNRSGGSGSVFAKPSKDDSGHSKGSHQSREALKKKQQKRLQKLKDMEEEREKDKQKWQQFATGKKSNKKKGFTTAAGGKKVSIFASPDGVDGRVGVGTCGISGEYPFSSIETFINDPKLTEIILFSSQENL